MALTEPKVIADDKNLCGEGPLFDFRRNCLFWTDIDSGKLYRYDVSTKSHRQIYSGDQVGGFTLQTDGSLLLFRQTDITRLDPESGQLTKLLDFNDPGIPRFNDAQASPTGACFAGTMGHSKTSGGLFLLTTDNTLKELHRGTNCSNGIGWSPDRKTLYWTCSTRGKIFAFDYDETTDALSNERLFHQALPGEGTPDGMAVDSQGNIYSARWGGSGIYVYSPDGKFLWKTSFPAKQVSSLCFGGPDLKDVYVTTAGRGDTTPGAGALYHCRSDIPGQKQYLSNIRV